MANIVYHSPGSVHIGPGEVANTTTTTFSIVGWSGSAHFDGSFTYDSAGTLVGGTVIGFEESGVGYPLVVVVSGLWLDAVMVQETVLHYGVTELMKAVVAGPDTFSSTVSSYSVNGGEGNDTFVSSSGYNQFTGDAGIDTAIYHGPRADYAIKLFGGPLRVITDSISGRDGSDMTYEVERLVFSDQRIAYDRDGAAGQAYRLYQAAFDRKPDLAGLGFQISAMDQGLALWQVAGNFIVSPEFQNTYGTLNDVQFVTQLYANVLHRAPDQGGLAYHVDHLAHGFTRADVLIGFSESPENKAALVGILEGGIVYEV
jgi:serralysin